MKLSSYLLLLFAFCAIPVTAQAKDPNPTIRDDAYSAKYISQSVADPIAIPAGSTQLVTITFKNTGTATWKGASSRYISAYTVESRYHAAVVASASWISDHQTPQIPGTVAPGQTGELTLELTAPNAPGKYREEFYLAAENYSWVDNGYFYLDIVVTPAVATAPVVDAATPEPTIPEVVVTSSPYTGSPFFKNVKSVQDTGGTEVTMKFAIRNTSSTPWEGVKLVNKAPASMADTMWITSEHIATDSVTVAPGALYRGNITFRTPPKAGAYEFEMGLETGGEVITGANIAVPITVTADAAPTYRPVSFTGAMASYRFPAETTIRVGIKKLTDDAYTTFTSTEDDYMVYAGVVKKGVLKKGNTARLTSNGVIYTFSSDELNFDLPEYIRLVPVRNSRAIFSLGNFDRHVSWKGPNNFNTYRGVFEYRHANDDNHTLYGINELGMEDYTAGISEVSNGAPLEMQKAQAIVSRTYAQYIMDTNKHEKRHFDVVAHTGDQLYLGYESERITPQYVRATRATRGEMVTHNGDIVITPYFGHSSGHTLSFSSVWGGANRAWLVPVTAEYDAGKSLFGHGVGMSQRDAAIRADEEGSTYQELLHHYYTGVDIERVYE